MQRRTLITAAVMLAAAIAGAASWYAVKGLVKPDNEAIAALMQLELPDADGKTVDFAQWKGKPLVVNFWATWCAPCREEMPLLDSAAKNHPKLQFVGISVDDAAHVREFQSKTPVSYPLPITTLAITELAGKLGNKAMGLPFTVFVRDNGEIAAIKLGALKEADLRDYLAQIEPPR
ncbi:TlpA disulfide reductase family protein [Viridibacterium curvum]|uniref:Thioredoxin domain-containing protein n=1 Tax=Viridibacterium curvum TaxID=1101404 RepID=A0ABP9R8C5_9RHOO